MNIDPCLIKKAKSKASNSNCRFRVSAMGYSSKGNLLGTCTNQHRFSDKRGGLHAERKLIAKYGKRLKSIVICRVGNSGALLPIDPCETCQKIADKMGIKIYSLKGGLE